MSDYGAKVSRIGFDVNTASDKQLAFSSDWPLLPIEAEGEATIVAPGGGGPVTQDIFTHSLGYAPVFIVERISGDPFSFPLFYRCNTTKLWFDGFLTANLVVKWKVFRRPIKATLEVDNVNIVDATKKEDSDYGFVVTLPGKDISSTDKRNFCVRSDVRQLMVAKSGYIAEDIGGLTTNHNLGYKAMYLVYIGVYGTPNTFRLGSEADDLALTMTTTSLTLSLYGYPWPEMAYIIFKDTLTTNG